MPGSDAWMHAVQFRDSAEHFSCRASDAADAELRRHYELIVSGYFASAEAEEEPVLAGKQNTSTAGP